MDKSKSMGRAFNQDISYFKCSADKVDGGVYLYKCMCIFCILPGGFPPIECLSRFSPDRPRCTSKDKNWGEGVHPMHKKREKNSHQCYQQIFCLKIFDK